MVTFSSRVPACVRVALLACLTAVAASALRGDSPAPADEILGTWTGTSICVDKEKYPACNDESIIFYFTSSAAHQGGVSLKGDKVVNGTPVTMGTFELTFEPKLRVWQSEFESGGHHSIWTYRVNGAELEGTLVHLPTKSLVRKIAARKK